MYIILLFGKLRFVQDITRYLVVCLLKNQKARGHISFIYADNTITRIAMLTRSTIQE